MQMFAKWYSMMYMEIGLLQKSALRVKGKTATFVVNPQDTTNANAVLLLNATSDHASDEAVVLQGAGEYEIAGVKITGLRNDVNVIYSLNVEGVDVLVGSLKTLNAMQHKTKEHNVLVVLCDEVGDASFLTSLAVNAVIFYGEHAQEVAQGFEKEKLQQMSKYTTTLGKLASEMETILLA